MSNDAHPIVEFLNRGRLPFAGRTTERERIFRFWSETLERDRLGLMLVQGEAGVGKSRLFEEVVPSVLEQGGEVIHTRFYPESSASFASLLVEALTSSRAHRSLLVETPKAEVGSVVAALRRIARLRATLLIIEDVHLLEQEGLGELSGALRSLAEEHLSVICAERPVDSPARPLLEPFLLEEIHLGPLDTGDLLQLWNDLFGPESPANGTEQLLETTLGNPLAVRSAMRGALRGALEGAADRGRIDLSSLSDLSGRFRSGVVRYADGLAAHLDAEERLAASLLAQLGEVFDRATGEDFLDRQNRQETSSTTTGTTKASTRSGAELLAALRFKGVLATPTTGVRPLIAGEPRPTPLAFTHSLFHRQMLEGAPVAIDVLLQLLAEKPTLYSATPYVLLADTTTDEPLPFTTLRPFLIAAFNVGIHLLDSTDWRLLAQVIKAADRTAARLPATIPSEEKRLILIDQGLIRTLETRKLPHGAEHRRELDRLLVFTENPPTFEMARIRLRILRDDYWNRRGEIDHEEACKGVDQLLAVYPKLAQSLWHALFLLNLARPSLLSTNIDAIRFVVRRWEEARLDDIDHPIDVTRDLHMIRSFIYRTDGEFTERHHEFLALDRLIGWQLVDMNFMKLIWYYSALLPERYLAFASRALRRARDTGTIGNERHIHAESVACRVLLGLSLEETKSRAQELIGSIGSMSSYLVGLCAEAFVLRGEPENAHAMIALGSTSMREKLPMRLLVPLEIDERSESARQSAPGQFEQTVLEGTDEEVAVAFSTVLARNGLLYDNLLENDTALLLMMRHDRLDGESARLASSYVDNLLEYLTVIDRRIPAVLERFLATFGSLLDEEKRTAHATRIAALATSEQPVDTEKDEKIVLSMIGEITVTHPGDHGPTRVRGGRLKSVLGLLVVDALLDRRLDATEFIRIAVEEDDPERGRKSMKAAIHRLRENIGKESLVVEEGRPYLAQNITVDLLEIVTGIEEADKRRNRRDFAGALLRLEEALGALGSSVLFPGLYDRMFEASRDQIEGRLRDIGVGLLEDLLGENDFEGADRLGFALLERMPEDEEIAAHLHRALVNLGRLAEAEKVRGSIG